MNLNLDKNVTAPVQLTQIFSEVHTGSEKMKKIAKKKKSIAEVSSIMETQLILNKTHFIEVNSNAVKFLNIIGDTENLWKVTL